MESMRSLPGSNFSSAPGLRDAHESDQSSDKFAECFCFHWVMFLFPALQQQRHGSHG